jgi:hypothetical protein
MEKPWNAAGTVRLAGTGGGHGSRFVEPTVVGSTLYFLYVDTTITGYAFPGLRKSDGTAEGPVQVAGIGVNKYSTAHDLVNLNGKLFFFISGHLLAGI